MNTPDARIIRVTLMLYRALLLAYPRAFREQFGGMMQSTFRDGAGDALARAGGRGLLGFWFHILRDLAVSAARERSAQILERLNTRRSRRARVSSIGEPIRRGDPMDTLLQDIRYALRTLLRQPGFAAVAVLTLALGIGANTALFSVVKQVLLEPLPYRDPDQIAMIWSRWTGFEKTWVSVPEYQNYQASLRSFEDLALFQTFETSITDNEMPERVTSASVTVNFFDVLGVSPVVGRVFTEEEADPNATANVVLIAYELWQHRFQGAADVLGRTLDINGVQREIVGVLPAGFGTPLDFKTDRRARIWFPLGLSLPVPVTNGGGSHGSYVIGRLRAGVTAEAAGVELEQLVAGLRATGVYPVGWNFQAFIVTATDEMTGTLRGALLILLGAVGFVLLIACVNVANLLLVRGQDRRREVGVRAALGANGVRLVRQLLSENLMLGVAGGTLGVVLAWAGVSALRATAPANLARVPEASIDAGVLAFTALLSIATALLFGLVPALHVGRADLQGVLKEGGRANTAGIRRNRVRRALVMGEVSLAVVLAVGAALMFRSFWNLTQIDPGFRAENVLTMRLSVPAAFYPDDAAVGTFYSRLLENVRALPGVQHAGLIRVLPIDQEIGDSCIMVQDYVPPPGQCAPADWQAASDGYFQALGLRLVQGRFIEPADARDAPQVMVVNEAFVRQYFPDGIALGKNVRFAFQDSLPGQMIVGVVGDARHNGITGQIKPTFYRPLAQWARSTGFPQRSAALVVRTTGDAIALAGPVRAEIRKLDGRLPVSSVQPMEAVLSRAVAQPRFTLLMLLAFSGIALLLAVVGIYGVVSYAVAARRQELGIRIALGAAPHSVVWLSLRDGLVFSGAGVALGLASALAATKLLQSFVYEVATTDPATYVAVGTLGVLAAFTASWIPARRASRADPLTALRAE